MSEVSQGENKATMESPGDTMRLRTRLFDVKKDSMAELASFIGISAAQLYRVKAGQRGINEKFIVRTLTAFPQYKFEELFYIEQMR